MTGRENPTSESIEPNPSYFESAYHSLQALWVQSALRAGCLDTKTIEDLAERRIMAPTLSKTKPLSTGAAIPCIGLGVFLSEPGATTHDAVASALKLGYRHIDTAQKYENEADVGRAVRDSGIPREEVFVTSKLWIDNWGNAKARAAVEESLRALDIGYIDLFLLHAPGDPETRSETWEVLESFVDAGKLKAIGVSNFGVPHLQKLLQTARIRPAVNQIELHPFLQWREEVAYCQSRGIVVEAYSPLVKARKMDHPVLRRIATRHSVEPAQVLVRWALQKGFVVLPKSTHEQRQRSNADVWNFNLNDADMEALDALEEGLVTGWDPIHDHKV